MVLGEGEAVDAPKTELHKRMRQAVVGAVLEWNASSFLMR